MPVSLRPMFPILRAEVDAVLAPFDRAIGFPAAAYEDPAVFAHEEETIFRRSWLCVGRERDVSLPGEWLRAPVTAPGVVVVRGVDLELRAFHNVCRHRGTPLVDAPCGRATELRCPYHGWTYELSGALASAPFAPDGFDRGAHGLAALRVATWQGFVFVAAGEGPALAEYLRGAPPWLEGAPLAETRRAHATAYDVAANWKLVVQNFQESLHFGSVHPALERLTPLEQAYSRIADGQWLGGTMELAPGVETVSVSATRSGRPFLASPAHRGRVSDAMLFPTLLTSLQPDYLLTYRLYPVAPACTHVVAEIFVHPAAPREPGDARDVTGFWDVVNAEDRQICERQQIGIRSPAYRPARYATVEEGVHAFDVRIARAYAS